MAENTVLRNNALPYPVYGVAHTFTFTVRDADGAPVTSLATPDSEISKNGDTFADCTNEVVETGATGVYSILLTAAEMTADQIVYKLTNASSAPVFVMTIAPRKLPILRTGTSQGGAVGYVTLDASAGTKTNLWAGCLIVAVIDGTAEARICSSYDGTNQQASVIPDWNVAPDADDTFTIYLPEGRSISDANVVAGNGSASTFAATIDANVTAVAADAIDAGSISAAAIAEIQSGLATAAALTIVDDFLDTEIAAIKAQTDLLPSDPADQSLIMAELAKILSNSGYLMARQVGTATGAQTAAPVYAITKDGATYTVTFANATSAGNRDAATLATT